MFQSMRLRSKGDKGSRDGERKTDLELDSNVVAEEAKDNSREEVTVSAIGTRGQWPYRTSVRQGLVVLASKGLH